MTKIRRIRRRVLSLTQAQLAAIAGVTQTTVSRWESGELEPDREQLARIRSEAFRRDIPWSDAWFFDCGSVHIKSLADSVDMQP